MREEKYLQFIASFLIGLALTIPLNLGAYAGINRVTVKGSDGIEGIARQNDALDFSVDATSETTNITKDHVYLGSNIKFDKCTGTNNAATCTLKYPSTGKQDFGLKPFQFAINFFKNTLKTQLEDSKPGIVIIDNLAPRVQLSVANKVFSGAETIAASYEVTDLSCNDQSCAGKCVGIKNIELHTADSSFKQTIEVKTAECTAKDKISLDPKKLKEGQNTLIAKATDKFGQASAEVSAVFTLDLSAPKILAETFVIARRGVAINSYSPFSVPVEIFIDISASDLDASTVTADLTALNPAAKNVKGACQQLNSETHRCKWLIDLNPGTGSRISGAATASDSSTATSSSKSIIVNAADIVGNKASVTINKALTLDDKGPVVQSISAGVAKDGKIFARQSGNQVTAAILESTGLNANEVSLNVGSSKFAAESCRKEAGWTCRWSNINFGSSETVTLSIGADTTDILSNPVSEPKSIEIIVDNTPPVITGIGLTSVGSLSEVDKELFKVEDKIAVEANITEQYDVSAAADFSKFISKANKVAGTCKRLEGERQQCTWLSDPIALAGTNNIKFTFADPAGNEAAAEKSLTVLELDTTPIPDFWKNSVECSPASIDRQLGTLINQRLYCSIKLEKQFERLETLRISPVALSSCKSSHPIIQSVETFNNERGSTEPFLKIELKKDELKINEAKLSCTFSIISKFGDKIVKNPENEVAEIDIKFYNFPLGKFDELVQKKIDDAKKDARESQKLIGSLKKIIDYSRKICRVFGVIYNVVVIFTTVTVAQKVIAEAMKSNPLTAGPSLAVDEAATGTCYGQQSAEDVADKGYVTGGKFCKFVNCQWAPGVIGKYQEWISNQINKLPLGKRLPGAGRGSDPEQPFIGGTRIGLAGYMDPENNLFAGALFACVPGIISGLDKYRQIKCLYADCLENAVAKDGIDPATCDKLKEYAECKHLKGELFALVPYAAAFDYFMNILRNALSNPFAALPVGLALTVGSACKHTCPKRGGGSTAFYVTCQVIKITSKTGEVLENVQGIYKEGFKIRDDYCARLDLGEDENNEEESQQAQPRSGTGSGASSSSSSTSSSSTSSSGNR